MISDLKFDGCFINIVYESIFCFNTVGEAVGVSVGD